MNKESKDEGSSDWNYEYKILIVSKDKVIFYNKIFSIFS